jgi:uncharacterized membrane protein
LTVQTLEIRKKRKRQKKTVPRNHESLPQSLTSTSTESRARLLDIAVKGKRVTKQRVLEKSKPRTTHKSDKQPMNYNQNKNQQKIETCGFEERRTSRRVQIWNWGLQSLAKIAVPGG